MVKTQRGKCYYSDIPMNFTPNTPWQCSLERLNNDLGYIESNVVLICLEFNTSTTVQWNREKFAEFLAYVETRNRSEE